MTASDGIRTANFIPKSAKKKIRTIVKKNTTQKQKEMIKNISMKKKHGVEQDFYIGTQGYDK